MTTIQKVANFWQHLKIVHEGKVYYASSVEMAGDLWTLFHASGSSDGGMYSEDPTGRIEVKGPWEILPNEPPDPRWPELRGVQGDAREYIRAARP